MNAEAAKVLKRLLSLNHPLIYPASDLLLIDAIRWAFANQLQAAAWQAVKRSTRFHDVFGCMLLQ